MRLKHFKHWLYSTRISWIIVAVALLLSVLASVVNAIHQ